ncbi:MAG: CGNR zinc finger domain-containing protein [Ekhidna sp.]|uniref:CGNR zinc finger domain-containing protein n=1 Tax=Ekhidna sp. TaxID=2608089 RepID=UPI0032EB126B
MVNSNTSGLNPGDYKGTYKLIGGSLCFDFANTMSWRDSESPHEWLDGIDNLLEWCRLAEIVNDSEAQIILTEFEKAKDSEALLAELIDLRELINKIFCAVIDHSVPKANDMVKLNQLASKTLSKLEVAYYEDKYQLRLQKCDSIIGKVFNEIVWSSIRVLTETDIKHIKKCKACHWLYIDKSRNNSRTWCTMEDCGNRSKVNRFNRKNRV